MKEKACGSGGGGEDRRLAGEGLENAEGGSADGDDAAMIAPGLVDDGGGGGWKRETFGMHMMARGVRGCCFEGGGYTGAVELHRWSRDVG